MDSAPVWILKTAVMCFPAVAPKAAGSLRSVTSATSATRRPSNGGLRFPKSSRLLARADFRRAYDNGNRLPSSSFTLFWLRRPELSQPRVGFTTPRALGGAVVRNRIKRRLREAVRHELPGFPLAVDYVFNPRRKLLESPLPELRAEVRKVFARCANS